MYFHSLSAFIVIDHRLGMILSSYSQNKLWKVPLNFLVSKTVLYVHWYLISFINGRRWVWIIFFTISNLWPHNHLNHISVKLDNTSQCVTHKINSEFIWFVHPIDLIIEAHGWLFAILLLDWSKCHVLFYFCGRWPYGQKDPYLRDNM